MTSAYDRWITRTPADWDDEIAYIEHEAREQGEADVMGAMYLTLEAQALVNALQDVLDDLCPDDVTDEAITYHMRVCHAHERAEQRLARREAK